MEDDHQEEEEEEEDFSFPSIVGNSPGSIDSPPWLYSLSNPKNEKVVSIVLDTSLRDGSREEKMDMLWEDFNEDLWGSSTTTEMRHAPSGDSRGFGFGKVTGLSKESNKGGGAVSSPAKRPTAVALVKAFRKLFLCRGVATPSTIKARHRRSHR